MEVLVEAERKYLSKLSGAMIPVMIDAFFDLYAEAKKASQGRKTLLQYQALLVEVKNWNPVIVKQHTDAIIKSCAMFPNLLAAVFVLSVKIMSAVRITSESKKMNIKLPTNDIFVHSCYMEAAKNLYEDPFIIVDDLKDSEKRSILTRRFTDCIQIVVDSFIPVQQILETYIPAFTGGELDMDHTAGVDPSDPAEEEPVTPATDPVTPATASTEALEPSTETPEVADPEAETKNVPVSPVPEVAAPATPAPVHQETLFDDAPEKK